MDKNIKKLFKVENVFSVIPTQDIQIIKLDTEFFTPKEKTACLLTGKITEGYELEPDIENRNDKIPLFFKCDVLTKLVNNSEVQIELFYNIKNIWSLSANSLEKFKENIKNFLTFEEIKKNIAFNIESEVFEEEIKNILIQEEYDYIINDDAVNYYEDSDKTMNFEEFVENVLKPEAMEMAEERINENQWVVEENKERILINSNILDEYVFKIVKFNNSQIKKSLSIINDLVKAAIDEIKDKSKHSPFFLIGPDKKIYAEKTEETIKEYLPYILNSISLSSSPVRLFSEFCKQNNIRKDVLFTLLIRSVAEYNPFFAEYNPFLEQYMYSGYTPQIKRNLLKLRDILIEKGFEEEDMLFKSSLFTNLYYYEDKENSKFGELLVKKINVSKEILIERLMESAAASIFFPYQKKQEQYINSIISLLNKTFDKDKSISLIAKTGFATALIERFDYFSKKTQKKILSILFPDTAYINSRKELLNYLFSNFIIGRLKNFSQSGNFYLKEDKNKQAIANSLIKFYLNKIEPFREMTIKEINKNFAKKEGKLLLPHEAIPELAENKDNMFEEKTKDSIRCFKNQVLFISLQKINEFKNYTKDIEKDKEKKQNLNISH